MNCKHCKIELKSIDLKCHNCGYPNNGTRDEKQQYVDKEIMNREVYKDTTKANSEAKTVLFVIAAINILIPIILVVFSDGVNIINLILYIIGAILYSGLGLLANMKPMIASIVGLVILLIIYLFTFLGDPTMIIRYIYLKIAFVGGLSYCIYKGYKLDKLKKSYDYLLN